MVDLCLISTGRICLKFPAAIIQLTRHPLMSSAQRMCEVRAVSGIDGAGGRHCSNGGPGGPSGDSQRKKGVLNTVDRRQGLDVGSSFADGAVRASPAATYTHGHHPSVLASHNRRTAENSAAYLLPHLLPSHSILDIGCGPGTITVDLAQRVPHGRVVGLDSASSVLEVAGEHAAEKQVQNVEFVEGDVMKLAYPDKTFDIVHAHQVLQHLSDPVGALREMQRVCKRGGVVAIRDADYRGMVWFPLLPGLDRWAEVYQGVAKGSGGDPNAGRRLLSWAIEAGGWREVKGGGSSWVYSGREEREWWGGLWAERAVKSLFAEKAIDGGHATSEELQVISEAWKEWMRKEDAWFGSVHGEVLCWV